MKKVLLAEMEKEAFGRGWIFRCNKAEYPYENKVEFMVREDADSPSGFSLIVISGCKAGLTLVRLPQESFMPDLGIGKEWLVNNWTKWIYPECPVEEVEIYRNEIGTS